MKERPILFSGPMVRAILEGRKSQTRRVVTGRNLEIDQLEDGYFVFSHETANCDGCEYGCKGKFINSPYGEIGDLLWVRETWGESGLNRFEYRAFPADGSDFRCVSSWRPSIHMPRLASRITLQITDIHVEELQEISEADALAEGITLPDNTCTRYDGIYRDAFQTLWDSINAKRGFSFKSNPWVWVIDFRKI